MNHPTIGLYLRVSTESQRTDSQREIIKSYIRSQNWTSLDYRWYEDKETGTNAHRKQLEALQRDIRRGSIRTVVVSRLDRLSRKTRDGLAILSDWTERGTRIISVQQNLDFNGAMGKFISTLLLALAEWERDTIVSRINEGLAAARARGVKLGRRPNTERRKAIAEQLRNGLSPSQIAIIHGISRQSVNRYMRMAG